MMNTQELICELEFFRIHLPFSFREKATEIIDKVIGVFGEYEGCKADCCPADLLLEIGKLQVEVEKYKRAAKFIAAFHTDSFKTLNDVVDASEK